MIIAVDFDGTIVEHRFPALGPPVPGAIETLHDLHERGDRLILYTMRDGPYLDEAVDYLSAHDVTLWGVNGSPEPPDWSDSPKLYANAYIDDNAVGVPLVYPRDAPAYVDWPRVRRMLDLDGHGDPMLDRLLVTLYQEYSESVYAASWMSPPVRDQGIAAGFTEWLRTWLQQPFAEHEAVALPALRQAWMDATAPDGDDDR